MKDIGRAARAYTEFLRAVGVDETSYPGTDPEESGRLAADLMSAWMSSSEKPRPELSLMRAPGHDRVSLIDLPFYSFCGHHFVPFFGTVRIDYDPEKYIAGLGGFMRVIDYYARRPQFQENFTAQIADHLYEDLSPRGVMITVSARQMCVELHGHGAGIDIRTRAVRGSFSE